MRVCVAYPTCACGYGCVHMYVCYVSVCVRACVCVCVRERERARIPHVVQVVNLYVVVNYMLQATVGIHEYAVCIISLFIRKISVRAYYNAMLVQRIKFVDM